MKTTGVLPKKKINFSCLENKIKLAGLQTLNKKAKCTNMTSHSNKVSDQFNDSLTLNFLK